MFRNLLLIFFLLPFLILAQNLPESYTFSDDNQLLLRGGLIYDEGVYSESSIDTIFLYFNQSDYWDQLHENYCDKINLPATLIYKNEVYTFLYLSNDEIYYESKKDVLLKTPMLNPWYSERSSVVPAFNYYNLSMKNSHNSYGITAIKNFITVPLCFFVTSSIAQ